MNIGLSILISTYNDCVFELVRQLSTQIYSDDFCAEIIVGDDGSTDEAVLAANRQIEKFPHTRLIEYSVNRGRAAIRNSLAREAQYDWLVFVDGDMLIPSSDFLKIYYSNRTSDVVYGAYCLPSATDELRKNLRYRYERSCQHLHTIENRQKNPYHDFHTSNFMVRKKVMLALPFDENFRQYGYEDTFWGKQLEAHSYSISHLNNPALFASFESNRQFLEKTEEGLRTLSQHKTLLKGFSRILEAADLISKFQMKSIVKCLYTINKGWLRHNLVGNHPSLTIFKLYRLGYFLSID